MKACFVFLSTAVAFCALTLVPAQGGSDESTPADLELRALRGQVDALQARIKTLEERSGRLESTLDRLNRCGQHPETPAPPAWGTPKWESPSNVAPPDGQHKPRIWGQREINGWTFYLIPCQEHSDPLVQGVGPIAK